MRGTYRFLRDLRDWNSDGIDDDEADDFIEDIMDDGAPDRRISAFDQAEIDACDGVVPVDVAMRNPWLLLDEGYRD